MRKSKDIIAIVFITFLGVAIVLSLFGMWNSERQKYELELARIKLATLQYLSK